ncbi:MAG: 3-phosphoshikimate 1-carboxyvinyltransferase [Pyrinomonadaceae bacterium]
MKVRSAKSINGTISLPGDKSISHRAALIAAIASGETRIENFASSADCHSTLDCLKALGVHIERHATTVLISGVGKMGLTSPRSPLDCGNSGTTMRLLAGVLAGQPFSSILTGDASLVQRPMRRIISPLTEMGAGIVSRDGAPPLTITGHHPLTAIEHRPSAASAQIKSCVLLAGLNCDGETAVIEPVPTRDHTERMLDWFGVDLKREATPGGSRISIRGGQTPSANDLSIAGDISSAAFFMTAAACLSGSDLTLPNVGINPTRRAFVDVLRRLGTGTEILDINTVCNEPVATIRVSNRVGLPTNPSLSVLRGDVIANLIDEIPILSVLGTQLEDGLEIRDAGELRVKESDRIESIVVNLRRMGANVTEFQDGFRVERCSLKGAKVDSFRDHRIAMAFAVAGLLAEGETEITGAEIADISFPGFFETLEGVVR